MLFHDCTSLSSNHTPLETLNIKGQQQEPSSINIVENYNHHLAKIGSHGSSLTLSKIPTIFGSENVRSEYRWLECTVNKELSSIS